MKLWQAASLSLLLPLLGQAPNQGLTKAQKDALLSRKKWYISYSIDVSGRRNDPLTMWQYSSQSAGVIELNHVIPGQWPSSSSADDVQDTTPGRFIAWMAMPTEETDRLMDQGVTDRSRLKGFYFPFNYQFSAMTRTQSGDDYEEHKWTGAGVEYMVGPSRLTMDLKKGTFDLICAFGNGGPVRHRWRYVGGNTGEEDADTPVFGRTGTPENLVPSMMGRKLIQDMKTDGTITFGVQGTIPAAVGPGHLNFLASFTISPTPPSTAKLIIEPDDDGEYEKWRPEPGPSETELGNRLAVAWSVTPGNVRPEIEKVTLRLAKVSRYPGVCMNWPEFTPGPPPGPNAPPVPLDLQFDKTLMGPNSDYSVGNENQVLEIKGNAAKRGEGIVQVLCFDGAAIGELVAEAQLADGRILTGELRSQPSVKKLLIPLRDEGVSEIAKDWRSRRAAGLKDESDEETKPEGDASQGPGDGLTVWEEYRGFFIGGKWDDVCRPTRKDLFIDNQVGALAQGGITFFSEAIPELAVHEKLLKSEHKADRVINFRKRADRWVTDQHCLVMIGGPDVGYSAARGIRGAFHPGPPKNTRSIEISPMQGEVVEYSLTPTIRESVHSKDNTVAHEIGHAIGIYHHGDGDAVFPGRTWHLVTVNGNKEIREQSPGSPTINVASEPRLSTMPFNHIFYGDETETVERVGRKGGEHSGDQMCMMRYSVALVYEFSPGPPMNTRVMFDDEEFPGNSFCTSPAGTIHNLPTHEPQSRFGGAFSKRGNCLHQFVISDKWEIQRRR